MKQTCVNMVLGWIVVMHYCYVLARAFRFHVQLVIFEVKLYKY